ncbi:MAG TPA: hypothetical protein VLE45_14735 [Burkholderiaceae bacterium]|nr:hypothetical protein [Burkholderiaceae bacterium]
MADRSLRSCNAVSWLKTALCAVLAVLATGGTAVAQTQAAVGGTATREAFGVCDARAFLALNIARNYMMTGRNRETVMPHLRGDAAAEAMAEAVLARIDAGAVRHPGEAAADALFECAAEQKISVGASRQRVALCFTRTDVAFFLHVERSQKVVQQQAVSKVRTRLASRELYPAALINSVADAVYTPAQLPDLRQLMGSVAWACIREPTQAASAASP